MYENKTIEEVCRQFECNGRTGLTQEEAGIRLDLDTIFQDKIKKEV